MAQVVQIKRTSTIDQAPTGLAPGELAVEMSSNPVRLWVGVPAAVDPALRKLISSNVIISDTPPTLPAPGQLWWESDAGILWIWYADADSSQWVQAAGSSGGGATPVDAYTKVESDGLFVNVAGDTMTGNLTLASLSPGLYLNKTDTTGNAYIAGTDNLAFRWLMELGGTVTSDFSITRYDDLGVQTRALTIARATGVADFSVQPTVNGVPIVMLAELQDALQQIAEMRDKIEALETRLAQPK